MDALAAADIFLFEGLRLDRRGGVLFGTINKVFSRR